MHFIFSIFTASKNALAHKSLFVQAVIAAVTALLHRSHVHRGQWIHRPHTTMAPSVAAIHATEVTTIDIYGHLPLSPLQ